MTNFGKTRIRSGTGRPLLALATGTLMALGATACGSKAAASAAMPPPPSVSVANVLSRDVRQWDEFTGRISAVQTVELRPRVSGYVERVAYREGQVGKKGDLLFVIDPRRYQAALNSALADLERARSQAHLAQTQDTRAQALVEAKAISREDFETRRAATAQGNAAVHAAEAAVASARLDLQFTQVRSPIDGMAGRAMLTEGNLAQADTSLLATVVSLDPVHVYFESDEQTFLRYNALARAGERDRASNPVRVGLANETGYPHAGTVDFIDNQVDPRTGTIRARAVLPNPDHVFTPGLFARVQLQGSGEFKAMLVDDKAVLTDQDRKYVYVLGPKNTAQRKDIVIGPVIDGLRVVRSGLAPRDKVIIDGVQKGFFPGMPVDPKTVAMDTPAQAVQVARADEAR